LNIKILVPETAAAGDRVRSVRIKGHPEAGTAGFLIDNLKDGDRAIAAAHHWTPVESRLVAREIARLAAIAIAVLLIRPPAGRHPAGLGVASGSGEQSHPPQQA
jgi:hypothetical protein